MPLFSDLASCRSNWPRMFSIESVERGASLFPEKRIFFLRSRHCGSPPNRRGIRALPCLEVALPVLGSKSLASLSFRLILG